MVSVGSAAVADAIDHGIGRAVAYLAQARDGRGLWRDFPRPDGTGGSDVWVSAFVAANVGSVPEARPVAAEVVTRLFDGARDSGGWGYDEALLEDCDSTAWVLLAARAVDHGLSRASAVASLRFVLRHQSASGGFATYGPRGPATFGSVPGREGWFTAQPCVSAAAVRALAAYAHASLPELSLAARYLRRVRSRDHLWYAYWWRDFAYATRYSVDVLTRLGALPPPHIEQTARAIVRRRNPDGGWGGRTSTTSAPFATALATGALLRLQGRTAAAATGIGWLLDAQASDGSFPASAELFVPGGRGGTPMTILDRGLFTTACAVSTLDAFRRSSGGPR